MISYLTKNKNWNARFFFKVCGESLSLVVNLKDAVFFGFRRAVTTAPVELHEVPSWKLTMYDERTLEPTCARPVTMSGPCRQTKSTSEFSVSFFFGYAFTTKDERTTKEELSPKILYRP